MTPDLALSEDAKAASALEYLDRLNAVADRLEIPARIESRCAPLTEEMLEVIRRCEEKEGQSDE